MPTARKKEMVKELAHLFNNSEVMIFTDYRGLKVSDLNNLRRQLRDKGVEYHITKNSLTTLAANRAGRETLGDLLDGPTAIAFVGDDIPGAAKVLQDFVRTSRILTIRGGLLGKQFLNADQVGDLTKILTREEYIAKMMGSLNSPVSNLVSVLSNTIRGFVNVLQARVDQMNEGSEPAQEAIEATTTEPTAELPTAEATTEPATEGAVETTATEPTAELPTSEATTEGAVETTATEAAAEYTSEPPATEEATEPTAEEAT